MLFDWPEEESAAYLASAGRAASLPLEIGDCGVVLAVLWADARVAQGLIAPAPLRVVEPVPGRTLVTLMGVDYRDNPWGDYNEAAILFPVSSSGGPTSGPAGRGRDALTTLLGRAPHLVYRMPVDQAFTMHAGRERLGMPKDQARIDVALPRVRLEQDGGLVFSLEGPSPGWLPLPSVTLSAVGVRHGEVLRFRSRMGGRGLSVRPGGAAPEIGEHHPLARELRALGLPRRPLFTASVRSARLTIEPPEIHANGGNAVNPLVRIQATSPSPLGRDGEGGEHN
jgi:hypothetical protein